MTRLTPRCFSLPIGTLALTASLLGQAPKGSPEPITLKWLSDQTPSVTEGVQWGVPWPQGALQPDKPLALNAADGTEVPIQSWPLAYWPDGSLKWSGHSLLATPGLSGPFSLSAVNADSESGMTSGITVEEGDAYIDIDTGKLQARIGRSGEELIESLRMGDRIVAQAGKLIAQVQDQPDSVGAGPLQREQYVSSIESATLEQSGPIRAVVKIEGHHRSISSDRSWLPFTVRLYFYANSTNVRLVHSFIFDGDSNQDFVQGLGIVFAVPFAEDAHNRHIRFAGDDGGIWTQPVVMAPGYRPAAGPDLIEPYAAHLEGERLPDFEELPSQSQDSLSTMPAWGDAKLSQPGPNTFSIKKRTNAGQSWVDVTDGGRSLGLAALGDVSGGIAVGMKDFWQKNPSSIEILDGDSDIGKMKLWFWSPAGPAMDLRHYSEQPHGLSINYEDWKPGWSTPVGIANTTELSLWAFDSIPPSSELAEMAKAANHPARIVATPEYYQAQHVFGRWTLPDRSNPTLRWIEDQIEGFVDYYRGQVEERSWYGFWNYGDLMHNYDFVRNEWRYDIGGWAWINTELMPDMLLWYTFLRTGRADIFHMAEAMTRHTSEVDVHHIGPFAPLGSRHNVVHWGDGAKQPRISYAGIKNFHYYLTTDERTGDLMRDQLDADHTYAVLQRYNAAHYIPTSDGGYTIDTPRNRRGIEAPEPEELEQIPRPNTRSTTTRLHADWIYYAMNWMTEWERTKDSRWRDRILTDMEAMVEQAKSADRPLIRGTFGMLFGGPESMYQMEQMFDYPEFWTAWAEACGEIGREASGNAMTAPRLLAYAAQALQSEELGKLAWERLIGDALDEGVPEVKSSQRVDRPGLLRTVHDPIFLGKSVEWQLHGPASVQWALNALETMALAAEYLPAWEAEALPEN